MSLRKLDHVRVRRFLLLTTVLVLCFEIVACSSASEGTPAPPSPVGSTPAAATITATPVVSTATEYSIQAADFSFGALPDMPSGLISFTIRNDGQEPHHAQIVRLKNGKTMNDLQAAIPQGEAAIVALVEAPGGPGVVDPGQTGLPAMVNLQPGQHALLCFVPSADGVPHLAKGMVRAFNVAATQASYPEPKVDMTITLKDFSFVTQTGFAPGRQVWKIVNEGPQLHEAALVKLAPGKTPQDASAYFVQPNAGPPPFLSAGGMQALDTGKSGFVTEDLQPGTYLLICNVSDPATRRPHFQLGMIAGFTIQ
jgi:hypothetical protein